MKEKDYSKQTEMETWGKQHWDLPESTAKKMVKAEKRKQRTRSEGPVSKK